MLTGSGISWEQRATNLRMNNVNLPLWSTMLAWVFKAKRSILFELLFILFREKKRDARVLFTLWISTRFLKINDHLSVLEIARVQNFPTLKWSPSPAQITFHLVIFVCPLPQGTITDECSGWKGQLLTSAQEKKNAAINKLFKKQLLFSLPIWQFKLWDEFCSVHCRCKMCENKVLS